MARIDREICGRMPSTHLSRGINNRRELIRGQHCPAPFQPTGQPASIHNAHVLWSLPKSERCRLDNRQDRVHVDRETCGLRQQFGCALGLVTRVTKVVCFLASNHKHSLTDPDLLSRVSFGVDSEDTGWANNHVIDVAVALADWNCMENSPLRAELQKEIANFAFANRPRKPALSVRMHGTKSKQLVKNVLRLHRFLNPEQLFDDRVRRGPLDQIARYPRRRFGLHSVNFVSHSSPMSTPPSAIKPRLSRLRSAPRPPRRATEHDTPADEMTSGAHREHSNAKHAPKPGHAGRPRSAETGGRRATCRRMFTARPCSSAGLRL